MVLVSRMEAYQQDRCGLLMKPEPLDNPMGFRSWTDLPRGFEDFRERELVGAAYGGNNKDGLQWFDMRGDVPSFSLSVPDIVNQNSEDLSGMQSTGSPGASHSSGISYDCNFTGNNVDSSVETDPPLSSYLLDGNVRAMLKKVTVNEEALNQTIQSLGGGEKGLKHLMGYIMLWVKENKGEKGANFFPSQNLKSLQRPPPSHQLVDPPTFGSYASNFDPHGHLDRVNRTFETVQSSDEALDVNQLYQRAKSRRLMDDGEVDSCGGRGTFVDVRGSIPDGFRFPKPEMSPSPAMISGMPRELDIQQPVPSCLQPSLSFPSGYDGLTQALTATTRAARRNRIARQRHQQSPTTRTPSNGATAVSSGCGLWSIPPPPTLDMRSAALLHPSTQRPGAGVPANSGRKVYNLDMLTFLLQKELRPSDVGNLGRIILPKKEAEMHLPSLALREGVSLQMEDFDSGYGWTIRYRFWPNNKSRMYLLENTGEFVKSHHLEEGDRLILYRNQQGNYILRGKKKVHLESRGAQGSQDKHNAHSLARGFPEAPLKTNVEVLKEKDFGLRFQEDGSAAVGLKVKAEPTVLVGDDDPFFKEDLMHNFDSSFGAGLIQPLERFPSLNLDFPLDEIMAGNEIEDRAAVVPKTEPAG